MNKFIGFYVLEFKKDKNKNPDHISMYTDKSLLSVHLVHVGKKYVNQLLKYGSQARAFLIKQKIFLGKNVKLT